MTPPNGTTAVERYVASTHDIARMWCSWNAHLLEEIDFTEAYGLSPKEFFAENKAICLEEWKIYTEKNSFNAESDRAMKERPKDGSCTCDWEAAQGANDTRGGGKEGVRLWWCPIHRNTCKIYPLAQGKDIEAAIGEIEV